jgi:hypothetical protein
VTDKCYARHTNVEFLDFLKLVAKTYPRVKLHVVADNYATHKHPTVKAWVAKNPRVTMHFTPTSGTWLNLVVRHEVARDAVVFVKGGLTDVEDVALGPVRKDRPHLGVRRG